MSSNSIDDVYLPPRGRRPSFDSFVETSFSSLAGKHTAPARKSTSPFEADMPSALDTQLDAIAGSADPQMLEESEKSDDYEHMHARAFTGNRMSEVEGSSEDVSETEEDHPKEYDFDAPDSSPSPKPRSITNMVSRTRSRSAANGDADQSEEEGPARKKSLRQRTDKQKHPYQTEKARHSVKTKLGKGANSSDVDAEMAKSTQGQSKGRKSKLPANRKTSNKRTLGRSSGSRKTSTESTVAVSERSSYTPASFDAFLTQGVKIEQSEEQIAEKTILWIYLKGDEEGVGAPVSLEYCLTIEKLMDIAKNTWSYKEGNLESIQCKLPWKKENKTILIREGMEHSFDHMLKEIRNAPAWKKGGDALEVKLMVTLV